MPDLQLLLIINPPSFYHFETNKFEGILFRVARIGDPVGLEGGGGVPVKWIMNLDGCL